jgi:RNA polymerase sigma factor (sigma-70 family)
MTALMPESERSAGDARWERVWEHHDALLRIARRRCVSWHDAEDVVGQAMLAAMGCAVPDDALAPWLRRVVMNLCVDSHRAHERSRRLALRAAGHTDLVDPGHEEHVVTRLAADRISAEWARLPERQRQVLAMRSDGVAVTDIALQLGLPYKTVESLLSRARSGLRGVAQSLAGLVAILTAARRRGPRVAWVGAAPAVAAAFMLAAPVLGGPADGAWTTAPVMSSNGKPTQLAARQVHAPATTPATRPARRTAVARRPAQQPSAQPIVPRLQASHGPVHAGVGGLERRRTDQSVQQSVRQCLSHRPDITGEHVGCADG